MNIPIAKWRRLRICGQTGGRSCDRTFRCDTVFDSLELMLASKVKLDAVAIFSGATSHYKHVELCMKRGLHTLSAVPAVMSLEEAEKLVTLKRKTGLKYMMAETSYYRMATIYARNLFRSGGFGKIFYSELEYYHDGGERFSMLGDKKSRLYEPDGTRSWRYGLAPMHYPTHSLGFLVGVTGERVVETNCYGWGDGKPPLDDNPYKNPFYVQSALMRTNRGNISRCNVFWQAAAIEERAQWFGEKGTLYMANMDVHPDTWKSLNLKTERVAIPEYWKSDLLPEPMRHKSGHGGSHTFLSAEFVNALVEDREPAVDVYEALAMTVPGIVAHQSSLNGGETRKVPQYERV